MLARQTFRSALVLLASIWLSGCLLPAVNCDPTRDPRRYCQRCGKCAHASRDDECVVEETSQVNYDDPNAMPNPPTEPAESGPLHAVPDDQLVATGNPTCPSPNACGHGSRFSRWWRHGHHHGHIPPEPLIGAPGTHDLHPVPTRPVFAPVPAPVLVPVTMPSAALPAAPIR